MAIRFERGSLRPSNDLIGASILLIEADFDLGSETKRAFQDAGAVVLGPYGDSHSALRCAATQAPSCAVVDINLRRGANVGVSMALHDKGIPLLIVTASGPELLPKELASLPFLRKPVSLERIVAAAITVVSRSGR